MNPAFSQQSGVGLIEVMIALFILAFGALAIANMQVSSMIAVNVSSNHLSVNSIAEEMTEHLKADPVQAGLGTYNTVFDDGAAADELAADYKDAINSWKNRAANALPDGAAQINCISTECTVSLRWREPIITGVTQQVFNMKVPLELD